MQGRRKWEETEGKEGWMDVHRRRVRKEKRNGREKKEGGQIKGLGEERGGWVGWRGKAAQAGGKEGGYVPLIPH